MNSVIILEGPDNIGKSTLSDAIKLYDWNIMKPSFITRHWGPNKNKAEGKRVMNKFISNLRDVDNLTMVCDRSPFGEFVYGTRFRGYDPWTYFANVVDDINRLNTRFLFISFYADEQTYEKFNLPSKKDEEKEHQRRHMSKEISEDFINLTHRLRDIKQMDRLIINCNNYKTLDARNEYVLENVRAFLKNKMYEISNPDGFEATCFNPYQHFWNVEIYGKKYECSMFNHKLCEIGIQHVKDSGYRGIWEHPCSSSGNSLMPRAIFVGEAPGNYNKDKHSLPFYGDRSGDIFHNALRILNLLPTEVYVTNVIHCSPKNHDLGKYSDVKERFKLECVCNLKQETWHNCPVIALGRVADKTLDALDIDHEFVYHPSYFARINKPQKFVTELRKIAEYHKII